MMLCTCKWQWRCTIESLWVCYNHIIKATCQFEETECWTSLFNEKLVIIFLGKFYFYFFVPIILIAYYLIINKGSIRSVMTFCQVHTSCLYWAKTGLTKLLSKSLLMSIGLMSLAILHQYVKDVWWWWGFNWTFHNKKRHNQTLSVPGK